MTSKKLLSLFVPAVLVLALDQFTKWLIRTTPEYQNKTIIDGWLEFYFIKNDGMALGIDILPTWLISVIAIVATIGILIYLLRSMEEAKTGYLILMGCIIGGALGNISDRLFMGLVYGYGGILEGHVVDFIHFSLRINDWAVFPYIFNVADIAISVSIISLLIFSKLLIAPDEKKSTEPESMSDEFDMEQGEDDEPVREDSEKN